MYLALFFSFVRPGTREERVSYFVVSIGLVLAVRGFKLNHAEPRIPNKNCRFDSAVSLHVLWCSVDEDLTYVPASQIHRKEILVTCS